ncbi:hypothetical protein DENIS_3765 [Desulfonema ishimotonii]|uniref:Uncharacterized protein n=1 Tax=Desulfonema ishimotonii TaxID=45657 RepID=A0A401G0N4_9BACT|nr:SH3 domain-containing protein [Desulfonema ishimotonii]GBC62788.1 hypothetical protein DENIS_3765 [Desulfonema ishimotonii]
MKYFVLYLALALFFPVLPVQAQDFSPRVLVIDKDSNGTNVRDAPSGKVVHVIPYAGDGGVRIVSVSAASKGWFRVEADGISGWMHGSVLGLCAAPTEDGAPVLHREANYQNPPLMRIPTNSPVSLLDLRGRWLRVRYVDSEGKRHDGWLPEQVTTLSEGGLEECAAAWASHK